MSARLYSAAGLYPGRDDRSALLDFIAPQDHARSLAEVRQVTAGQARVGFENRYRHKNGHLVDIMWSASWSEPDQLRIGAARDDSERKQIDRIQAVIYAISEAVHTTHELVAFFLEVHRLIASLVSLAGFAALVRDPKTGQLDYAYPMTGEVAGSAQQQETFQRGVEVIRNSQALLLEEDACLRSLQAQARPLSRKAGWRCLCCRTMLSAVR